MLYQRLSLRTPSTHSPNIIARYRCYRSEGAGGCVGRIGAWSYAPYATVPVLYHRHRLVHAAVLVIAHGPHVAARYRCDAIENVGGCTHVGTWNHAPVRAAIRCIGYMRHGLCLCGG